MGTILDILSSMIFGGVLLMIILNANEMASENQSMYNGDVLVQQMLVSTARLIEGEFRNMGFGVPANAPIVVQGDSDRIAFLCDLDRNGGFIDTVKYSVGPTSELSGTQNELDRYLYRSTNSGAPFKAGVVTTFKLNYITRSGETLPVPIPSDRRTEVYVVEVTMEVQNPYAISRRAAEIHPGERTALFSSSLWQQTRLASQNSRR
jgi:hypothetical protein